MPPTLKTRKPIDKLLAADLKPFPIWELAADEEGSGERDETWVRPVDARAIRKGRWSLVVAADFTTASGQKLAGFVIVSTAAGVEITTGALVGRRLHAAIPNGDRAARSAFARPLGLTAKQAFPLAFALRVPFGREKALRSGTFE